PPPAATAACERLAIRADSAPVGRGPAGTTRRRSLAPAAHLCAPLRSPPWLRPKSRRTTSRGRVVSAGLPSASRCLASPAPVAAGLAGPTRSVRHGRLLERRAPGPALGEVQRQCRAWAC